MAWGDWFGYGWTASQVALVASASAVVASALYAAVAMARRRPRPRPAPGAWRKVGTLVDVTCYPVKSCAGIKLLTADCSVLGLKDGFLRDRVFMVMRDSGETITGRIYPKMTQIVPSVAGTTLTLSTGADDGIADLELDIAGLHDLKSTLRTRLWGQTVPAVDCGAAAAAWLSRALLGDSDTGLRLAYYPGDTAARLVKPFNRLTEKCSPEDTGAFSDETSYNLMTTGSVADLNARLDRPVEARQFRGNFLVECESAYAEDDWAWVRVGPVEFRNVRPCTRCLFTTVDPDTGDKSLDTEPLKTLKTYRKITDPAVARFAGGSPVLGIHLALAGADGGKISVGEAVYVQ